MKNDLNRLQMHLDGAAARCDAVPAGGHLKAAAVKAIESARARIKTARLGGAHEYHTQRARASVVLAVERVGDLERYGHLFN